MTPFPGQLVSPTKRLLQFASLGIGGDLGAVTVYRNKHGKVVAYPRTSPDKPPSVLQMRQRLRFKAAQANWENETEATKQNWETFVDLLNLVATGQNLYISLSLCPDDQALAAYAAIVHMSITPPEVIPP